jgi:hypothetical protein
VTSVRIGLLAPTSDGAGRRPTGTLEWRPTMRRDVSGDVVLPAPFTVGVGTDTPPVVNVAPTEGGWAWAVVERVQGGSAHKRLLLVPDVGTVVDYADLVEVDPATLDPVTLSSAWWTQVTEYVATHGGGGGGAVASVNGQIGAVVLGAADVGAQPAGDYATNTALSSGLSGKVNSSTYTAGLAAKADTASLATVATSGAYTDLTGKPTIPTVPGDIGAVSTSDPRLTDQRVPTDGSVTNAKVATGAAIALSKLATDPLARANHTGTQSADTLTDGTTNKAFLATERTKLTGIATGATANSADAVLLARANHTGTQAASTITGLATVATSGIYADLTGKPTSAVFNVKDYGAVGNGSTDDTTAVQAAIDAAAVAGGTVCFPTGTYLCAKLTLKSKVHLRGSGYEATILKLKNAQNTALLQGQNFATLTGGNTTAGINQFSIAALTIDGNKANQTATSPGVQVYGYGYAMSDVRIRNCLTDGIYTEWSTLQPTPGFDAMEAQVVNLKVHDCGGHGINWQGPHDSQFVNILTFLNGADGFHVNNTVAVINLHSWGNFGIGVYIDAGAQGSDFTGCISEGANTGGSDLNVPQVFIGANDVSWKGGYVYSRGTTSGQVGFKIGDATHTAIAGTEIDCKVSGCTVAAINFAQDSFGYYRSLIYGSGPCYIGTPNARSLLELVNNGGGGSSAFIFPSQIKGPSGTLLDDGGGVTTAKRFVAGAAANSAPAFTFAAAPSSPIAWGGTLGFGLDSGFAFAINGGSAGMYFMNAGVKGNTMDDGAGNSVVKGSVQVNNASKFYSGSGAPTIAGVLGDFYFRTGTPSTANQRIYICTTAGGAGAAVWTGIA